MKKSILLLMAITAYVIVFAHDIQIASSSYDGGDISFEYYEQNGARIPHGKMKFSKKYPSSVTYLEQGEMKEGLRDGEWTIDITSGNFRQHIVENYLNGLLEGEKIISCTKIDDSESYPEVVYNFKNGRLYGENTIVLPEIARYMPDLIKYFTTLVVNYNEKGIPVGAWTLSKMGEDTIEIEMNEEGSIIKMYEVGIMGKIEKRPNPFEFFNPIVLSKAYFKEVPFAIDPTFMKPIRRPRLPSLFMIDYHEEYQEIMDKVPQLESEF